MMKKENDGKNKNSVSRAPNRPSASRSPNQNSKSPTCRSQNRSIMEGKSYLGEPSGALSRERSQESSLGVTSIALPFLKSDDYKQLEDAVQQLDCYHGFICRQDLPQILKKPGDFLIRVTIQDTDRMQTMSITAGGSATNTVARKSSVRNRSSPAAAAAVVKTPPTAAAIEGRDFVVSVYAQESSANAAKMLKKRTTPIVNMAIRLKDSKYCIEMTKKFKTIADLLTAYKTETGNYKGYEFQLINAKTLSQWEWKHGDVKLLDKMLGEGAFGEVRVGEVRLDDKTIQVAVKMLKNADHLNRDQVVELLHEGRIMRMLDHKNVLRSYGVAVLQEPLYLMSELCSCGALREYLRENAKTLTLADRMAFCLGSAKGVEYLHSQTMIHRDLAVRNVLLTEDKTPKVSDFGLAKQTDRYEMKEACKVPVRYLAPETLDTFVFTQKSDVFSFGMVIWEIFENGQQPHDGKNGQTIRDLTKKRQFLKLNDLAPAALKKLVSEKIFVTDPENRCSMSVIVQCIEKCST